MWKINSSKRIARMAGFLYLIVAITAFFTFFVTEKLFVAGDAITTTNNIMTSGSLFSLSIISSLIMAICWVLAAFALYVLFKPVNKNYAFLMFSLVLIGGAITCINTLNQFAALLILNGADYLIAFETNQLQALTMLFLDLFKYGVLINHIFFGLWLFPLGYLVFKSDYFPKIIGKILGVLLIIAGLGYLIDFLTFFLFPNFDVTITNFTFWGELILLLWLLIKGVRIPEKKC